MALYTLKSRADVIRPLANYTGNNSWVLNHIASVNGTPSASSTQMFNALGRTAGTQAAQGGNDNFFVKRGKSIENALGTTGSAIASAVKDVYENNSTEQMRRDNKRSMNDIAKKYGFNSWSDWQDANAAARESGDTEAIKRFDEQLKEFQAQANSNADKANKKAADYKDYRENNYVSKKINQDNTKFLGSAINTLSTAADVALPGAGVAFNSVQGAAEGLADEMEQNGGNIDLTRPFSQGIKVTGGENFDWGRAGQNALIGGVTGGVVGKFNKGLSSAMAKRAAAKGITNVATGGVKNAIKNGAKTIGTGAIRGALSGAVGGATGAGLSSALNGVDFGQGVQNALQGAVQGAQQGAITGGIMAGTNMALSKTPGIGNVMQQLNEAGENWRNSGKNFNERLTNTLTSGDSAVGDWLMNKRQSKVLGTAGGIGNRVDNVTNGRTDDGGWSNNGDRRALYRITQDDYNKELESIALGQAMQYPNQTLTEADVIGEFKRRHPNYEIVDTIRGTTGRTDNGDWVNTGNRDDVLRLTRDDYNKQLEEIALGEAMQYPNQTITEADVISEFKRRNPYYEIVDEVAPETNTPTTAKGWVKKAGERVVEDLNNSNLGNRIQDTSSDMPEDIRGMQIRDYNAYADGVSNTPAQDAYAEGKASFSDALNEFIEQGGTIARDQNGNMQLVRPNEPMPTSLTNQNVQVDPWDRVAQEAGYSNYDEVLQRYAEANPNAKINPRGMAGQVLTWMDQNPNTPTTAAGWAKLAGQRAVEDINNSNLGMRVRDLSQEDASRRLYNALTNNRPAPTDIISDSEYGGSALANKTKRGMVADALERTGNFLEGAQSNATRPQLKDLGIESAGKTIENVRKKTGITNLETQAAFAKELTGGADSLMDGVQRVALTESADGKPYNVDTSDISAKVESIVDKYADTNMFGSQSKRQQFISNLRRDIASYDSDVLSIANRMKANATDYRGRGVADPKPADAAKAKIYTEIANELENLSYKAIPQENVNAMFDTTIAEMQNRAAQAKANGNNEIARAYTKAANQLNSEPRTIKAFRSFKKDFVDISKINQVSARAENGAAAQMGRSFGTGIKRLTGTLLQRPVNTVLAKAGGAINSVADRIDNSGNATSQQVATPTELADMASNYDRSTQLYNALGRTQATTSAQESRPANVIENQVQEIGAESGYMPPLGASTSANGGTTLESLAGPTTAGASLYNTLSGISNPTTGMTGYYQTTGDYWTDILASALSSAIDDNDVEAFKTLFPMYQDSMSKLQQANTATSNTSELNATQQAQLAKLDSADSAIDELESLFEGAGGGQGLIVGNLKGIAGNIGLDSGAKTYNDMAEGLVNQISAAIGKTDSLNTEGEVKRALKLIPQLTDDAQTARNKLEELRRMLATTKASYNSAYGLTY